MLIIKTNTTYMYVNPYFAVLPDYFLAVGGNKVF